MHGDNGLAEAPRGNDRLCGREHFAASIGAASVYLATELATAAPERLAVLLYDGAIQMCRQALAALDCGDTQLAAGRLGRTMQTVRRLQTSLESGPATPRRQEFADLYEQVHSRLIEADFYRRREAVGESISMLSFQRPAWGEFTRTHHRQPVLAGPETSWIG